MEVNEFTSTKVKPKGLVTFKNNFVTIREDRNQNLNDEFKKVLDELKLSDMSFKLRYSQSEVAIELSYGEFRTLDNQLDLDYLKLTDGNMIRIVFINHEGIQEFIKAEDNEIKLKTLKTERDNLNRILKHLITSEEYPIITNEVIFQLHDELNELNINS